MDLSEPSCLFEVIGVCFEAARPAATAPVFGVAEFLTAVAIFAVAYSMSDDRYKFRISVAWIPLNLVFFLATAIAGFALVIIAFWFELGLPIPRVLNNPRMFEVSFAFVFMALLATWIYVAFVSPPRYSRRNAYRFAQRVFNSITDGSEPELAAAVYEVGRSAPKIVAEARRTERQRDIRGGGFKLVRPESADIAIELLLLIADRRFCRHVARRFPWVAARLFQCVTDGGLGGLPVAQFSRNVAAELFADEGSAIHYEDDGLRSGLMGYVKPISTILFGNSRLVHELAGQSGSPLDPLWLETRSWNKRSWQTYNKAVLLYLSDYLEKYGPFLVPSALHQICSAYERSTLDSYKINDMPEGYGQSIEFGRLVNTVEFINAALELVEQRELAGSPRAGRHSGHTPKSDLFDVLAAIGLDLIMAAGAVNTPEFRSWEVQHNVVWAGLMRDHSKSRANDLFRARLQRLIWREIREMETFPNYRSARVIAVCLNTMGFRMDHAVRKSKETRALKRALLAWLRRHYLSVFHKHPDVARACTGGTITFDESVTALIKTYPVSLGREPDREIFRLS